MFYYDWVDGESEEREPLEVYVLRPTPAEISQVVSDAQVNGPKNGHEVKGQEDNLDLNRSLSSYVSNKDEFEYDQRYNDENHSPLKE